MNALTAIVDILAIGKFNNFSRYSTGTKLRMSEVDIKLDFASWH